MVVDANVYWLPDELFTDQGLLDRFLRAMPQVYGLRGQVTHTEDGQVAISIEKPIGFENLNYFQDDYTLSHQLHDMDQAGVDQAVLKLPGCQEWLDLDLCHQFNDLVAKRQQESNGRMIGLAVVPPVADEAVLAELDRAINQLHLHGVQLSAHYGSEYLDADLYRPLFAKIAALDVPVYVHHTPLPVDYQSLTDYNNLRRSVGRCFDQTVAVSRELFSDLFEAFPHLKLIHSMLGGGFFTYANMLFPSDSGNGRFQTDNDKFKQRLSHNIYFEMSHAQPWGDAQLQLAIQTFGADHVIYGSSYPVKTSWLIGGPKDIVGLHLDRSDQAMILADNAQRLYQFD